MDRVRQDLIGFCCLAVNLKPYYLPVFLQSDTKVTPSLLPSRLSRRGKDCGLEKEKEKEKRKSKGKGKEQPIFTCHVLMNNYIQGTYIIPTYIHTWLAPIGHDRVWWSGQIQISSA